MELTQVKGNTWCLEGEELIPLYKIDERHCILLDSGLMEEQTALEEALTRANLTPVGVLGSHNHIDHAGNHSWLRERYGTRICMSEAEGMVGRHLGILKMGYGVMSMDAMQPYLRGMLFQTDQILKEEDGQTEFFGVPFHIHRTAGHSPGHICIGTPDGVCYVGDLVMAGSVRRQAQLPYHLIHRQARASMEKMRDAGGYSKYIIAHRKIVDSIDSAVEKNLALLDWVSEQILALMEEPVTWEELMSQVLHRTMLLTSDEKKYFLYERAVQSFVNDLRETGRVTVDVRKGIRHFQRV